MNLSVSPNPINYPSPSPSPQPPPPSPSPESERAQTPPPPPESERAQPQPPSPESEKPFSKFLLRSKEERDKLLDEVLSKVIKKMREDRENGYEAPPSDPEHHNPGFRWRRERGLSVPEDYAWKDPPEHNPDDWKDVPVIPYMPPDDPHCEICGSLHPKTCCPYLYEFPPDGVLCNASDYLIVCECGQDAADGRCPNETCAPSNIRLVIRKPSSPKYDDCPTSDDSP